MPVTKIEREDLLIKCWEVFHRHGYYATSMSMLAEATGIGKSGLLHHFHSKENLMKSVLEFSRIAFRNYVLKVANEDLPVSERLEKLLRRQGKLAKIDRRGCFFANTALETGREEVFKKVIADLFEEWEIAIANIFTSEMGEEKARDFAYRLLLEYEGAITFYKFSGDESHIERFIERSVSSLKM